MRTAILAAGTRGDLQPVLALGDELTRRGHSVALTVNADLAGWVRPAGLEVLPMDLDVTGFLRSAEGQRLLASGRFGTLTRRIAAQERAANDSIVEACRLAAEDADVVLSTLVMTYRGRCVAAANGIPAGTLTYYPFHPTGSWASFLAPVPDLRLRRLNRASYPLLYRLMWAQNRRNVDAMCDTLGISRFRRRPRFEHGPTVHAYSPLIAPPAGDLPGRHEVAGTVTLPPELRSRLGTDAVPPDLDAWLDAGPPPVYLGFGSMPVLEPDRMLAGLAEVLARRGLRGLVGAGTGAPAAPTDDLYVATTPLDHDQVLPRCRVAVHHGGAGTTAAVLRAGLPSVVASLFVDQPFWGWRLEQLGAGVTFPFRRLTPERVGVALDRVLAPAYAARAEELGAAIRAEDGAARAADAVEAWAADRRTEERTR